MPCLFDPFVTTKTRGAGLGLAISKTIVEMHGGNISATNNADGGATFRFTLRVEE
jgi:two-component system, LuxR family, sensor kinase FixL